MTDFIGAGGIHLIPSGFQQVTTVTAAFALTAITTLPAQGANYAYIQCDTAPFRLRDDGTAPTASVGILIGANSSLLYAGNLAAVQLISTTGTGAANIGYYRGP